jgi:hypothetical protein
LFEIHGNQAQEANQYPELNETINKYIKQETMKADWEKPILEVWKNNKQIKSSVIEQDEYENLLIESEHNPNRVVIDYFKDRHPLESDAGIYYCTFDPEPIKIDRLKLLLGCVRGDTHLKKRTASDRERNTFNKKISRLKKSLERVGLTEPIFSIRNEFNKPPVLETELEIYYIHNIYDSLR